MSLIMVATGCRKEKIATYQVPKGSESAQTMPTAVVADDASMQMKFKAPAGWRQEAPQGMSLAQFAIGGNQAECSVMSFPGEQASQLNIVNIVRQTAGLGPLTEKQLVGVTEPVEVGGGKGSLVNLGAATKGSTNNSPNSVMVAVYPREGTTYFFKLSGKTEVVESQKPKLIEFLKSVSFVASPTEASPAAVTVAQAALPVDSPATTQNDPVIQHDPSLPAWDVPAGWQEVPPTEMLLAKFVVKKSDGEVDVTISSFPGDVGGALANVNRWRGMVKLPSIASADLEKSTSSLEVIGGKATLVDMTGQGAKSGKATRLIGVIWPRNGQTWFYKLMGDANVAAGEKSSFEKFVQSVRYPQ